MATAYQARWISRKQYDILRRTAKQRGLVLLDSFNGFLVIEPVGSTLGDGPVLSHEEAEYELQEVWCTGARSKLNEARRLLGLDTAASPANHLVQAG